MNVVIHKRPTCYHIFPHHLLGTLLDVSIYLAKQCLYLELFLGLQVIFS